MSSIRIRKIHRRINLISVIPLFIAVISGSLYSFFQYFGLDVFWLMKIHTGDFFFINLQYFFSPFLGFLTIVAIISGFFLYPKSKI